jgi:hypothetical protein
VFSSGSGEDCGRQIFKEYQVHDLFSLNKGINSYADVGGAHAELLLLAK